MIYRIKQFYRGLFARVTPEDQQFLRRHLNDREIFLFRRLRVGEQRHCLNIAYDCLSVKKNDTTLIKAALLHDVGKIESNLTLANKSLVVLIIKLNVPEKLLPKFLHKALYYKIHHPKLGAEFLKEIGTEAPVIFLTRYHHRDLTKNSVTFQEEPPWDPGSGELWENDVAKNLKQEKLRNLTENLQILKKIDEKN